MSKKIISFALSEQEIDRAIKELKIYRQDLIKKVDIFRERVASRMAREAQNGFNSAIVDDLIGGEKRLAQVSVSLDKQDNITVVIAHGEDAVWVEFGAGVYHNGSAGTSPHPQGLEKGFTIGGFGKGYGAKRIWGFYEDGELKFTHGTPSTMPMERAFLAVCNEISQIAREVFT